MSQLDNLHPVTTEGQILLHIANSLDEINAKLQGPAPAEPEPEPEPEPASADDKPAARKAPVKKPAARKRVNGQ